MRRICSLLLGLSIASVANAQQTTVTFKPGPSTGQDALLSMMENGCIPIGQTITPGDVNNSLEQFIGSIDWTYNALNCPRGRHRSILKFTQLSSIPSNATVVAAELKLSGVDVNASVMAFNSYYPGSPYSNTNETWLRKVTNAWNVSTVTYNNQPSYSLSNQIPIPPSAQQWDDSWSINSSDLVQIVQDWISDPSSNHGFIFMLPKTTSRSRSFASSNHSDSTRWPELIVTYQTNEDTCNTNFSYTFTTEMPNQVAFNPIHVASGATYEWTINGAAYQAGTTHTFLGSGLYDVCLMQDNNTNKECPATCISVCIGDGLGLKGNITETGFETNVAPNPSNKQWNVIINAPRALSAQFNLYDLSGRLINSMSQSLRTGSNQVKIDGTTLAAGVYFLNIVSDAGKIIANSKLIKE